MLKEALDVNAQQHIELSHNWPYARARSMDICERGLGDRQRALKRIDELTEISRTGGYVPALTFTRSSMLGWATKITRSNG